MKLVPEAEISPVDGGGDPVEIPYECPERISVYRDLSVDPLYHPAYLHKVEADIHFYLNDLQRLVPPEKRLQLITAMLLQPDQGEAMSWVKAMKRVTFKDGPPDEVSDNTGTGDS